MDDQLLEQFRLINQLKRCVADIPQLPEEPSYTVDDDTLMRFLRARDLKVNDASILFREDVEWRRRMVPGKVQCKRCFEKAGCHSFRMVGFDKHGHPLLYSSFNQASSVHVSAAEISEHLIYTMENAIRAMKPDVSQWTLVLDCNGLTVNSFNAGLVRECTDLLSLHYPERLAAAFCIRPSKAFKVGLSIARKFMPPVTAKKIHNISFDNNRDKLRRHLTEHMTPETTEWIVSEVMLNHRKIITQSQREFWKGPSDKNGHDPRGAPDYVEEYVLQQHKSGHRPHINILDALAGKKLIWTRSAKDEAEARENPDDEEEA